MKNLKSLRKIFHQKNRNLRKTKNPNHLKKKPRKSIIKHSRPWKDAGRQKSKDSKSKHKRLKKSKINPTTPNLGRLNKNQKIPKSKTRKFKQHIRNKTAGMHKWRLKCRPRTNKMSRRRGIRKTNRQG